MKKIALLFYLLTSMVFAQKAELTISTKRNVSHGITKNGYVYTLKNGKELTVYEPENFKVYKTFNFDFKVVIKYVSDNTEFISLSRIKIKNKVKNSEDEVDNYYNLINCEKLVGFNEFGDVKKLKKELDLDGYISMSGFYTNSSKVAIYYTKIKNKKHNNKKYYILTTDLLTNKTTYKLFTIDDNILLNPSRSFVNKYKLKKSQRKITLNVINHDEDSFTLMTRSYANYTQKDKYPTIQKTQLLKYDFEGNLLSNNILDNKIDSKMEFVDINSHQSVLPPYSIEIDHGAQLRGEHLIVKYIPNEISMGYVYKPEGKDEFYTYSILKGVKSKYGVQLLVSKFDKDSREIWSNSVVLSSKKPKRGINGVSYYLDISHSEEVFSVSVSSDFRPKIFSFGAKEENLFKMFNFNEATGEYSNFLEFDKIEYREIKMSDGFKMSSSEFRKAQQYKVKSISKKSTFSGEALMFYFINSEVKSFLENRKKTKGKFRFYAVKKKDNFFLESIRDKNNLTIYKF